MALNSDGYVAFSARVESQERQEGLWVGRPGQLRAVAMSNWMVEVEGKNYKMGRIVLARGVASGQGACLNDAGQLVYTVDLHGLGRTVLMVPDIKRL